MEDKVELGLKVVEVIVAEDGVTSLGVVVVPPCSVGQHVTGVTPSGVVEE